MAQFSTQIPENTPSLADIVNTANENLENIVNEATNRAFNLGCLIGLLPAIIFAAVTFLAAGFSIIGAAMAIVLGVVSAIAFANLAAMITRRNTIYRAYQENILPEIEKNLREAHFTRDDFDRAAIELVSPTAPLYPFIKRTDLIP